MLRCPKCRHEFAIRLRSAAPPAAAWPAGDPLSAPLPSQRSLAPARRQPGLRPPVHAPANDSGSSMLLIGIGAGAAVAVALVVLILIVTRISSPAADQQQIAVAATSDAPQPATVAPAQIAAAPATNPPAVASPAVPPPAIATAPNPLPAAATPRSPVGQPVTSLTPGTSPPLAPSPVPPAGPTQTGPTPTGPTLAYRFNSGEEYAYSFTVKAEVAGAAEQTSGMCSLTLSREAAPPEFAAHQKSGQGSGSGFVVTSDGYVVTCAHVVEGSTKIDVAVAGQSYPGQVFAFDKAHDLAVVRIIGSNLPTVPLGNSEAVELAQEVRAVGFPLSNVLGDSVKITRGTLAGIVNTDGRKLFQVDASINPGNSGGPLVNEMGHVVGVASAKLAGEAVDGVGIAVPANEVLTLLRSKGITPASASGGEKLDGPNLARRVTPAVAMLKVTIGPGGYGLANRLLLDFSGHVSASQMRTAGRMRVPGAPRVESERGKLLLSERGELLEATGNVQVPYLFGPLGALIVEPLGSADERTWQTQRVTALTQVVGEQSNNPLPMRIRHRGRSPFTQSQTKIVVTPAMETTSYELAGTNGDLVSIKKRYTFQTLQPPGTPPMAQVTGEGTITFNRAKGFAEKFEYKATLVRSVSNVSVTVPLTLQWQRLDQQTLDKNRAEAQANLEAAKKAAAEKAARDAAPPTPQRVDELLEDLSIAKEWHERLKPLDSLARMQPIDQRRAQVTKAAEPLMRDGNFAVRDKAIQIMGRWGTKETVPVLLKMLEQLDSGIRHKTIEALGEIADPSAAKQVAALVPEQSDRHAAVAALKKMGHVAEPAVIDLLKHRDSQVRYQACQILEAIGGPKSVAAIKRLLQNENDGLVRLAARGALDRLAKKN
ncbi:MAG TPA: trypsin-like peptidase domain-containing protein [Pirellulales bacterium]|nr:trypsin-like peptidase domain-containing protein [Pirellulales bacterium]